MRTTSTGAFRQQATCMGGNHYICLSSSRPQGMRPTTCAPSPRQLCANRPRIGEMSISACHLHGGSGSKSVWSSWLPILMTLSQRKGIAFRMELTLRVRLASLLPDEPYIPLRDATDDKKTCVYCSARKRKMKRCSGCHWASYCNEECQRANWRVHKETCCPDYCLPVALDSIRYTVVSSMVSSMPPNSRLAA